MTNKAYIVATEQQEREVLENLEREDMIWISDKKPTEWVPSSSSFAEFPYTLFKYNKISWGSIGNLSDEEIVYDGRKESKMSDKYVVPQEFMDALKEWKDNRIISDFVNDEDIRILPINVYNWWHYDNASNKECNTRLIAIIRWVNGEDVFEVEKSKKWVVRSKLKDDDGYYWYVSNYKGLTDREFYKESATRFDTKEEAEGWANSHQEVIEVKE